MKVDLLVIPDCPNRAVTLARLRTALAAVGLADLPVAETVIGDAELAAELGMHGSPTVLIDGNDPFAEDTETPSVSCRLYRTAHGNEGAPSVDALIAVLDAARRHANEACCDGLLTGGAGDAAAAAGRLGFLALWRGERPPVAELADPDTIATLTAAGRLEIDEGRIVGIHGLTTRPTSHRIDHETGSINTWCAFDAIGIPAALGIDATATTMCPTCDTDLTIPIRAGVVDDTSHARLWLPTAACDHLVEDFCRHANLYCNYEHLTAAITADSSGEVLSVGDAAALGRAAWSDIDATQLHEG